MRVEPITIRLDLRRQGSKISETRTLLKDAGVNMGSGLINSSDKVSYSCLLFEVSSFIARKGGIHKLHECYVRRSDYSSSECSQNTTIPEQFVDMIITYLFKHGRNPDGTIMKNPCAETPLFPHECLSHEEQLGILEKRLKKGDKIVIADDAEAMWLPMDQRSLSYRSSRRQYDPCTGNIPRMFHTKIHMI